MKTLPYCILLLLAMTVSAEARTWTAKTGQTMDGEFVKLEDETVSIQLKNEKSAKIKLDLLSDEDRQFVLDATKEKDDDSPFIIEDSPFEIEEDAPQTMEQIRKAAEQGDAKAQYDLGMCYLHGAGIAQDGKEAVRWLRKAANQGLPEAQYDLGVCYDAGFGVAQDGKEAVKWFRKAADQGDRKAQFNLGVCYEHGAGVAQNGKDAVKWYRKSAEQGLKEAQFNLGVCYLKGIGVAQDLEKAAEWFHKAAEQGHAKAIEVLSRLENNADEPAAEKDRKTYTDEEYGFRFAYPEDWSVKPDMVAQGVHVAVVGQPEDGYAPNITVTILQPSGDLRNEYLLNMTKENLRESIEGMGIQNIKIIHHETKQLRGKESLFCHYQGSVNEGAASGVPLEIFQLMFLHKDKMFIIMITCRRDSFDKNRPLFDSIVDSFQFDEPAPRENTGINPAQIREAAEQGDAEEQNTLGVLYLKGIGVEQDNEQAAQWFHKAAEQGHVLAQFNLGLCYDQGVGVAQDSEQAAQWFRKAAEQGHVTAQLNLGLCYHQGIGVAQDNEQAAAWFHKAAEQGHAGAQFNLGVFYLKGIGVAQDAEKAVEWFRKAAEQGHEEAVGILRQIEEISSANDPFAELKGHTEDVWVAVFSPDGKKIVTTSPDETIRIWDAESGKELRKLEPGFACRGLLFSPDSRKFITSNEDIQDGREISTVQIWDADSGKELRKQVLGVAVGASENRKKVIALNSTNKSNQSEGLHENVQVWDVDSGKLLTLKPKGAAIAGTCFALPGWYPGLQTDMSPDGTKMVSVRQDVKGENSVVQVWDTNTGRELRTLGGVPVPGRQKPEVFKTVIFSRNGSLVALHGSYVGIWDVQSGKELQRMYGYTGDFSPDGTKIATVGLDDAQKNCTVHIWDVKTGRKLATLGIEGKLVLDVLFSPDGKKVVAHCSGSDTEAGPIPVFDADSGRKLFELEDFPRCFSSDSKTMVIERFLDEDGVTQLLDAESGKELLRWKGRFGEFSSDGKKIATLSGNTVRVWTLPTADAKP